MEKTLGCYDSKNGCYVFYCSCCDKFIFQSLGCNSRICSCCGKRYTDQWSNSLSKAMFPVPHRHIVMSVPDKLWEYLDNWDYRKVYMDAAIKAFNDYFSKKLHRKVKVGVIVILHPYGKDMRKQPHLHLLITEGAFDNKGTFLPSIYIPADGFRKTWQHHVLKLFQANGLRNNIATQMYKQYSKGFYVWLHSRGRIKHPRIIAKYIGRYVRHPAIANSRIKDFNGKYVKFYYVNNDDKEIIVRMSVDKFITALIQHIPPPQFKMIRYYGAYARRNKSKYGARVQSSIRQTNLREFGFERISLCPFCKKPLVFICYQGKGPPKITKDQRTMVKWIDLSI